MVQEEHFAEVVAAAAVAAAERIFCTPEKDRMSGTSLKQYIATGLFLLGMHTAEREVLTRTTLFLFVCRLWSIVQMRSVAQ